METEIKLRPLGKLMNLIESSGFSIEYQHDDLVFVNNTAFLFRFDEENVSLINLHFNIECDTISKDRLSKKLLSLSKQEELNIVLSADFEIKNTNTEKEEFQIVFK